MPPYIRKIARAIHEKRGIPLSEAIPFAIGRIKKWAAGGDNVTAETKAKAAAAIAAWERLKGKAKLTEAALPVVLDANLGVPTPLLLAWLDEIDAREAALVEAGAAGGGAGARMTASTSSRARAGAIAARKRPPVTSSGKKFDESKHPRGGKGSTTGGKFVAKGSSGSEVRAVQRRIGARVDGEFGAMTEAAVRKFQRERGLEVDGIIGRQTVAALRGRKDAKRVKVGELTEQDRSFLSGHVRGKGRRRDDDDDSTSSTTRKVTKSKTPGGRTKTTTTVIR